MSLRLVSSDSETDRTGASLPAERTYLRLAAHLHELIRKGEFAAGQRLPAERALAEQFNVSRTTLREAIIALEIQGVVEVRGGSGISVCAASGAAGGVLPLARENGPSPFELLRARGLIESEIAAAAAASRTDGDLDRMFAALATMREKMDDKGANAAADRQFHLHIAAATDNSVLVQSVANLWDMARGPIWTQIEQHFHLTELRLKSQDDHQRIFAAIMARNAEDARAAMRGHLERVMNEFAQSWR
ncbi:MAG: putative L-lactate dehydrogenase operon regulatory protein [Paracidovorax wautersii]|uniref:Putative L-lactate dehydrogenase operon regulatory protein n=1 Tax=Paracidovorax wautersii TaxID=1177982 RepID=A0A7V8FRT0_9BURK|nr:MAG: putative L-lactate dehydrogenase operon regulatory protein [Paracidovorax wautersii]